MSMFELGKITAPVGIKGEVRVMPFIGDYSEFSRLKEVFIEGEKEARSIEKCRADKAMMVLKLSGINDRNSSEAFRNKKLLVPKDKLKLAKDSYFVDELVGIEVYSEDGVLIGKLSEVVNKPTQDLYMIETPEGKTFLLPAVKDFILDIDTDNKRMKVHLIDGIMDL